MFFGYWAGARRGKAEGLKSNTLNEGYQGREQGKVNTQKAAIGDRWERRLASHADPLLNPVTALDNKSKVRTSN